MLPDQLRIQSVRLGEVDWSNIWLSSLSLGVHSCKRDEVYFHCCDKTMDGKIALYGECCFPNLHKMMVNKVTFVGFRGRSPPPLNPHLLPTVYIWKKYKRWNVAAKQRIHSHACENPDVIAENDTVRTPLLIAVALFLFAPYSIVCSKFCKEFAKTNTNRAVIVTSLLRGRPGFKSVYVNKGNVAHSQSGAGHLRVLLPGLWSRNPNFRLRFQVLATKFSGTGSRTIWSRFFLRRFRDPIRVPTITENYHRVPRIREVGSLQIHIGYLTFSLKKIWFGPSKIKNHCIIFTTRLPRKLCLWNWNPNFRLRLYHLKYFGSGSSRPQLLWFRLRSPVCYPTQARNQGVGN